MNVAASALKKLDAHVWVPLLAKSKVNGASR